MAFPDKCVQASGGDAGVIGSEDCLYLNVWAPAQAASGPLPVMVYVHGGGNMSGSTSDKASNTNVFTYEGQALAERGHVIVVTVQYRLNALGYFVHPALDAESATHTSGNYGLMDQLAALGWVRDNIAAFGGNPARVLLFGESGGATDVCALYASPKAAGLFSAAIMESGSCAAREKAAQQQWSAGVVSRSPCASAAEPLSCLRGLAPQAIVSAIADTGPSVASVPSAGPTVDGEVLTASPLTLISQGHHNHVPFIVGSNASETAAPMFGLPQQLTATQYEQQVRRSFAAIADQVLLKYPLANFATPRAALVAVTTDAEFTCPARSIARAASANQAEPVYRYFFSQVMGGGPAGLAALGSSHGLELYYVFQHLGQISGYTPTSSDTSVETTMLGAWTSMAASGQPGASGTLASWPRYASASDPVLEFGSTVSPGHGVRTSECDFWDAVP